MTNQEVFEASFTHEEVIYNGQRWTIQSTYNDNTADLEHKNMMGDWGASQRPVLPNEIS
ncbi:MAG TPA: hypothetical protein K8W06_04615 [Limosilactobacillus coleohominis]|nr:hypothetical protein [Limosilactobacillus coleohominis]